MATWELPCEYCGFPVTSADANLVVLLETPDGVKAALARPEVACVLVPPEHRELLDLDLTELTYG